MLKMGGWRAGVLAVALSAGLGASGAQAQVPPGCVQSNPNSAAAGALIGGVAGALLGNAASGHRAGGTVAGGVAGALVGGALGGAAGATPCPQGYVYREAPPPRPVMLQEEVVVAPPPRSDFWYGAPPTVRERIVFLRHRIERLDQDGWLSPRETEGLSRRVAEISRREVAVRDRNDGMLPPPARAQLNEELSDVARRLRWKEYRARHAEE